MNFFRKYSSIGHPSSDVIVISDAPIYVLQNVVQVLCNHEFFKQLRLFELLVLNNAEMRHLELRLKHLLRLYLVRAEPCSVTLKFDFSFRV